MVVVTFLTTTPRKPLSDVHPGRGWVHSAPVVGDVYLPGESEPRDPFPRLRTQLFVTPASRLGAGTTLILE